MAVTAPSGNLGFRRIDEVHIRVTPGGATAEVRGMGHRLPRSLRVPLRTATRLVHEGARLRITRD